MKKLILVTTLGLLYFISNVQCQINQDCYGRIGIGISASSLFKLKVNGATYSTNLHLNGPIIFDYSEPGYINTYYSGLTIQGSYGTAVGIGCNYSSSTPLKVSYQSSQPTYTLDVVGNARISGTVYYGNFEQIGSDGNIKKNIKQISQTEAINNLYKINGISYEYKSKEELTDLHNNNILHFGYDTVTFYNDEDKTYREEVRLSIPNYSNGNNFGFIAQDVEKIFPELVKEDSLTNIKSISYTEFIPLLLEALKEQNETIKILKSEIEEIKSQMSSASKKSFVNSENSEFEKNFLFQNFPNPFTESTQIRYFLTENVKSANLYIYNMSGIQLKSIQLHQMGNSSVTINGGEFQAGIYIYTLIADGFLVGTNQMILTD